MKKKYTISCNVAQTLNIIGDRWTLLIIHEIFKSKKTYKELEETLVGIPSNLLSNRLKELEENGIITTELYQNHPPRHSYVITKKGLDLKDVFYSIILWGGKYLEVCYKELVEKETGDSVEIRYYNPKTKKILDYNDVIPKGKK